MEIRLNTTRSNIHIHLWCTNFRFNCTKQNGCQQGKDEITTCFKSQKILLKWNLYDFHKKWSATTKIWLNALPMLLIQERKMELNWNLTRSVWFLNEIENPPQKIWPTDLLLTIMQIWEGLPTQQRWNLYDFQIKLTSNHKMYKMTHDPHLANVADIRRIANTAG